MRVGSPIQLQNYQKITEKIEELRGKPVEKKTTNIFSTLLNSLVNFLYMIKTTPIFQKYVVLESGIGKESTRVTLNEIAKLLSKDNADAIYTHLKKPQGSSEIAQELNQISKPPSEPAVLEEQPLLIHPAVNAAVPDWVEMRENLQAINESNINKIKKSELIEIQDTLEAHWDEVKKYGQWDEKRQVLHLRRNPEPGSDRAWTLPRSVEIHYKNGVPEIYVLHKGVKGYSRTPKLGSGGFKEVARSVNLRNLKSYVHATIDLQKKALKFKKSEKETKSDVKREVELQSKFKNDDEFVSIGGWNRYNDKNGSPKMGITMEMCNGGELFAAGNDPTKGTGKLIGENIDNLMQVVTDMIQMLVKLEREGIINRDIKPENIFLDVDDKGLVRAKMSDLGLAWTQQEAIEILKIDPGGLCGTPGYVAPEYATEYLSPEERSGFSTHTWQMGLSLYYLLRGCTPNFGTGAAAPNQNEIKGPILLKDINRFLATGSFQYLTCLNNNNNPKHLEFLREMVSSMLKVDYKMRPTAAELLQRLENFKKTLK